MSTETAETSCLTPSRRAIETPPYLRADLSVNPGLPILQLSKNESAMPLPSRWLDAAARAIGAANTYPDPDCRQLRRAIAETFCLDEQRIVCSAGLMECLQSIALAYLDPGDNVVIPEYGFAFFRNVTELAGAQVTLASEKGFQVDADSILQAVTDRTKMVIFANPGNPTGTYLSRRSICELRSRLPASALLVIDEAYAEFVREERYEPLFDLTNLGNVIVLRTFSKTYALAGFRVGWAYCPPGLVEYLRRIQVPAIVNSVAQAIAAAAVRDQDYVCTFKHEMRGIRDRFVQRMTRLHRISPVASETNFVLLRARSEAEARSLDGFLRQHGIVLRRQTAVGLADCLRASVGTEDQMRFVADKIVDWCEGSGKGAETVLSALPA
jgi:histidinol-phosphate aminotransferase